MEEKVKVFYEMKGPKYEYFEETRSKLIVKGYWVLSS